ncbi:E3 ubiquitin-protein ligase Topors [Tetranychus urticae]|uniref:RING-type E3 ubiquitin transferase n=1 Tax=Tetranychus urticae TaxID=32264 RepID=T1JX65_TETUR|nr:E3 ubiquitin-protein ligase Topors [Tetranychus urticae]
MAETGRKKRLPELGRLNGRGFLSKSDFTKEGSPIKPCSGGSPKRPQSPAPNCSICLGGIEDQSFANKCFHSFCKTCLFEWSKVKPECPVCRQGFDSIIFNVKAMDDYEEYNIPRPPSPRRLWSVGAFISESGRWETRDYGSFNILRHRVIHLQDMFDRGRAISNRDTTTNHSPRRLSFYYAINPTAQSNSNTTERTPPRAHESSSRTSGFHFDLSAYFRSLDHIEQRTPAIGTCAHRRYLYENDLWVQPISGRLERECSASFYRNNPAVTHRLLPFLNRELIAIMRTDTESSQSTENLLARIKAAIFEYDIPSIRFRQVVEPFMHDKTHHFLHELFYFAKSPYTIEDYNNHAVYLPRAQVKTLKLESIINRPFAVFTNQEQESDSSTSDSVIEVVDSEQEQGSARDSIRMNVLFPSSPVSTITPTTETTATTTKAPETDVKYHEVKKNFKKSSQELTDSEESLETPLNCLPSTLPQNINVIEDFDNPRPGPSGLCRNNDFNSSNQKSTADGDGSDTEIDVKTNDKPSSKKQEYDSDSGDSDDSIKVVGYKKPIGDRTPEVINISSCCESDNEKKKTDSEDEVADEHEPKRKKPKVNFSSLFHPFKSLKTENGDEKITDSEDSDSEEEKHPKRQKKRRRTRSSHCKRRRVGTNRKLNIDYESTDTSSSDSDLEMAINQISCRRIPSVIVRPNRVNNSTDTFASASQELNNGGSDNITDIHATRASLLCRLLR